MRKAAKSLSVILFVLGCIWIYGCGSGSDLLDEQNSRYTGSMAVREVEAGNEMGVDIAPDDCDFNATTTDDAEPYGPTVADITVAVAEDALGMTLKSYEIQYIARPSEDGTHNIVMPPTLDSPLPASYNISISPGEEVTFTLTAISTDTKEEYRLLAGWTLYYDAGTGDLYWIAPTLQEARYTIRFTLHFEDENLEERTMILEQTVWFGDFDNC